MEAPSSEGPETDEPETDERRQPRRGSKSPAAKSRAARSKREQAEARLRVSPVGTRLLPLVRCARQAWACWRRCLMPALALTVVALHIGWVVVCQQRNCQEWMAAMSFSPEPSPPTPAPWPVPAPAPGRLSAALAEEPGRAISMQANAVAGSQASQGSGGQLRRRPAPAGATAAVRSAEEEEIASELSAAVQVSQAEVKAQAYALLAEARQRLALRDNNHVPRAPAPPGPPPTPKPLPPPPPPRGEEGGEATAAKAMGEDEGEDGEPAAPGAASSEEVVIPLPDDTADWYYGEPRQQPPGRCCLPRVPKTSSQSFWHIIQEHCAQTMAGHLLVNGLWEDSARRHWSKEFHDGHVERNRICPRTTVRMMIFRDPIWHYRSMKSMLNVAPAYFLDLIKQHRPEARRSSTQLARIWQMQRGSPEGYDPCKFRSAMPPDPPQNATPEEFACLYPEIFASPQTRYLLGYPFSETTAFLKDCPVPRQVDRLSEGTSAGMSTVKRLYGREGKRATFSRQQWERRIVHALLDLDFFAIVDDYDKSLIMLQDYMRWSIPAFHKVLHKSDTGHPGEHNGHESVEPIREKVRQMNYWDDFLYTKAKEIFHHRWQRFLRQGKESWANKTYRCQDPGDACSNVEDAMCHVKCVLRSSTGEDRGD